MVTESSRLDRRDDLDAQAEILLGIRSAGGDVISIAEPRFGKTDFAGRIVTLVAQHADAEKSKTVKQTTYRGISMIIYGSCSSLPMPPSWRWTGIHGDGRLDSMLVAGRQERTTGRLQSDIFVSWRAYLTG
jgi:hypothetical protein